MSRGRILPALDGLSTRVWFSAYGGVGRVNSQLERYFQKVRPTFGTTTVSAWRFSRSRISEPAGALRRLPQSSTTPRLRTVGVE